IIFTMPSSYSFVPLLALLSFRTRRSSDLGYDATIYSMVYYPENHIAVVGLGVILILGISWFFIARWMSRTMAEYNAGQLSTLVRSEEHTSELQSRFDLVCRLLLDKKNWND